MIKISKAEQAPITLRRRGVTETTNDRNRVSLNHPPFLTGTEKLMDAISEVYGSGPVKNSLLVCHNGKCCYCERKKDRVEIDIEHYRPKRSFTEDRADKQKKYPGYYWLAYEWENLYLSCKECNITWKGTSFPLKNPLQRSRWHGDANTVANEQPLLVNPSAEPRDHIRFDGDAPYPVDEIGLETIEELGLLKRVKLRETRVTSLKHLRNSLNLVESLRSAIELGKLDIVDHILNTQDIAEAVADIEAAILPSSEFTSMAIDFLDGYSVDQRILDLI